MLSIYGVRFLKKFRKKLSKHTNKNYSIKSKFLGAEIRTLTLTTPDILYSIASLHLVYLWPWSLWRQLNWPNSSSPHRFNLAELCKLKKIMFYTKKIEHNIIVTIKLILKNLIIFQLIFCPNQYDIYFQRYSLKIIQDITLWCSCKLILLYNC